MTLLVRLACRTIASAVLLAGAPVAWAQTVDVYKRASCGCCTKWADHLRSNGFTVRLHEMQDLDPIKQELGVPKELAACHTAKVEGYVVEGHVPADLIRKLLKERPQARGMAVPGMPAGSPGMEGPRKVPYEVLLIRQDGSYATYATR